MYSTISDSFDPAGRHDSIVGMRQRISERAERVRQFSTAPPKPEETSVSGGGAGAGEKEDDDELVACPRNCGDCGGLRYGCGITRGDIRRMYAPEPEPEPEPEPDAPPPSGGSLVGPFALNWSYYQAGWGVPGGGLEVQTKLDITLQALKYITDTYEHLPCENIVHWELHATNGRISWDLIRLKPREPGDYLDRWNSLDDLKELPTLLEGVQMSQLPLYLTFRTDAEELALELVINHHIPDEEFYGTGRTPGVIDDPEDDPYYPHDHSRGEEEEMRAFQEEQDREEEDKWRDGGGQGCGRCIDVCRCHCYDSD